MKLNQFSIAVLMALGSATALAQAPGAAPMCGGIGQADQQRMKAAASSHDLMLTFATTTGSYLADIDVKIRDSKGAVIVDSRCDGPIMLANVSGAGKYRVTATSQGVARDKTVTVASGKRPTRATFVWSAEKR